MSAAPAEPSILGRVVCNQGNVASGQSSALRRRPGMVSRATPSAAGCFGGDTPIGFATTISVWNPESHPILIASSVRAAS